MMDLITQFAIDCAGQKEWDFPKDPKSYTFTPDELEKFAELIIAETCKLLAENKEFRAAVLVGKHFPLWK